MWPIIIALLACLLLFMVVFGMLFYFFMKLGHVIREYNDMADQFNKLIDVTEVHQDKIKALWAAFKIKSAIQSANEGDIVFTDLSDEDLN